MADTLTAEQLNRLEALLRRLINQHEARILVAPNRDATGFWFGGGNMVRDADGRLWLCGRYRNYGDSRTGLAAGERGLECALFCSEDDGASFAKVSSWSKADLSRGGKTVLSIEGTSLLRAPDGTWELYVSSEKDAPYPDAVSDYLKPGCGVWSIDVISGPDPGQLGVETLRSVLAETEDAGTVHVKDPVVFRDASDAAVLIYCSHPFCWTCSNTGYAVRRSGERDFTLVSRQLAARGLTWDVAAFRVTARMPVPRVGLFEALPPLSVFFYDGAECVRELEQNSRAVSRPRGFSCEEIGGACWGFDHEFPAMQRISALHPLFISPWGTGCSRYVDVLADDSGCFATWQRSQSDLSQPLVGHRLGMPEIVDILS